MATTPPIGGDDDDVAVASTKTSKNSFDNLSVSFRKLSSSSLSSRSWLVGIITSDDAAKRKSIRPNNQQHLQNDTTILQNDNRIIENSKFARWCRPREAPTKGAQAPSMPRAECTRILSCIIWKVDALTWEYAR
jgi:hypothetical protein